jgi:RimJ/RimL family protein N-acetyltransferase
MTTDPSDLDKPFESERLLMAPLRVDDANEMAVVLADPSLHEFIGGRPFTVDELRRRYADLVSGSGSASERWLNWIVRRRGDGVAVGYVQATVMAADTTPWSYVAWTIGTPWQRQGLASEASSALVGWLTANDVAPIVATIHADHVASNSVATRIGLHPTSEVDDGETVWTNAPADRP